jgi:CheY-like chemotaxis protein/two-component sensor histidine kinase
MSHDLRTPLNAILGFAQLLDLDDLPEDRKESVSQILRGGTHLLSLINEVLDIARIEAGHLSLSMEPVHVIELAELAVELVAPLATARGITVAIDRSQGADVVVLADRQRLNQILLNLLSNAVKYNRPGGAVTVGCRLLDQGRARLLVTDTGPGIAEAKLALLFQPFERLGAEQTAVEGTGLGLALSRGLAEAMGGALGVDSAIDRGSTFWIELARTDEPQPRRQEPVAAAITDSRGTQGTLLYIEDNHSNVRLMQRVLERRPGVRLLHAGDGETGLALAGSERPDLIFLDLHLPDMSGEEVLGRLAADPVLRRIPVAVLSADATLTQSRRLTASGAVAYLTKPLEIRQVMNLIDERLEQRAGEPGAETT